MIVIAGWIELDPIKRDQGLIDAKPYIDMGVKDFCIGADIAVVQKFCKDSGESLLKLLGR